MTELNNPLDGKADECPRCRGVGMWGMDAYPVPPIECHLCDGRGLKGVWSEADDLHHNIPDVEQRP